MTLRSKLDPQRVRNITRADDRDRLAALNLSLLYAAESADTLARIARLCAAR